jgi:hypothetical protein
MYGSTFIKACQEHVNLHLKKGHRARVDQAVIGHPQFLIHAQLVTLALLHINSNPTPLPEAHPLRCRITPYCPRLVNVMFPADFEKQRDGTEESATRFDCRCLQPLLNLRMN